MTKYMLVATDPEGNPVCIGPLPEAASDELYAEIESWGWTVHTGQASIMTVGQARRETRNAS